MNRKMTKEQALNRAAALCSGSEHCTSQIREKLSSWGIGTEDAAEIIARLTKEGFIDERRFARAYCHDKFAYSHWGRMKIRQMLRHLQLSDGEIEEGLSVIPDDAYLQAIDDAVLQKDRTLHETDPYQRKGKLVRHLVSRGFETGLAVDAAEEYLSKNSR